MSNEDLYRDETLTERKALLERFGGLPETTVQNTEWLYMLEQDTRHSLAIEGYFASEEELKQTIEGKRSNVEALNYFRAAQAIYDQALQFYRDRDLQLRLSLVRHIHSELFRNKDERRGQFRLSGVQIKGALVRPPEYDIEGYLRAALGVMVDDLERLPILSALARAHTLFESIHPFHDGNGRAGRILLNYLAISKGYPPIIIKGLRPDERERYYRALQAADVGFHAGFPDEIASGALRERLDRGDFDPLCRLLADGLLPRLDRLIVRAVREREELMTLAEVAKRLGVREPALRKRIERGTLLFLKEDGGRVYSHPELALSARQGASVAATQSWRSNTFSWLDATPIPLTVALPDGVMLDAGVAENERGVHIITPPTVPMIDQLLAYLDTKPHEYIGIQSRHMGIGMAALCVRWGSYLATLLDTTAPLHPELGARPATEAVRLIADDEMRRMNIEVSYAISRLAGIFHERGLNGLVDVLTRAYLYLPMPQRVARIDRDAGNSLVASLRIARIGSTDHPGALIPPEHADRAIANILALWGWRNTTIEQIHAGTAASSPLLPHQRRLRPREASHLLREVSSRFASYYFWFDTFFGDNRTMPDLPHWPETAMTLAGSFLGTQASGWSLTDTSALVTLSE